MAAVVPPIPELTSAITMGAVAVLALNDQILKAAAPGVLTGKLSDLAGCFVLPLFVSAVLAITTAWPVRWRLAVGVATTVVFFAAIKLSPAGATAVAGALKGAWALVGKRAGPLVADPTDLVALPLAVVAYSHGVRVHRRAEARQRP